MPSENYIKINYYIKYYMCIYGHYLQQYYGNKIVFQKNHF